jgi:4-amino-4-deoxy-L-arabinose transferase-like glycosyltransferase
VKNERGPFLLAAVLAVLGIFVRPALPIDETRYLQVFQETLLGSPVLLSLVGEPYGEKPPLLFWLARPLTWLGLSPETALRLIPALATALTVLVTARIGRRANLELAGWVQAVLLFPLLCGNLLLFDPLLTLALVTGTWAWLERRAGWLWLGASAALLSKGPVALVFLVAGTWALAPLRRPGPRDLGRTASLIALAFLPLAAWALGAAALGGPDFARALLWDRWAGRLVRSFAHRRAFWFYVPVVLVGALPAWPVLLSREVRGAARQAHWPRRVLIASGSLVLFFTLISGKQAHYLLPLGPLLALVAAFAIEHVPAARSRLRVGLGIQLGLLLAVLLAGFFLHEKLVAASGPYGNDYLAERGWLAPVVVMVLALAGGTLVLLRANQTRVLLVGALLASGVFLLGLQRIAGRVLFPHTIATAIADSPDAEIAYLGASHQGLWQLLSDQRTCTRLENEDAIGPWSERHPQGLLLLSPEDLTRPLPEALDVVARDVVHTKPVAMARRRAAAPR